MANEKQETVLSVPSGGRKFSTLRAVPGREIGVNSRNATSNHKAYCS